MIGLGTAALLLGYGRRPGDESVVDGEALLSSAIDRGVTYIDSAASYGRSEEIVGSLAAQISAHSVRVCTKLSASDLLTGGPARSAERLRTDCIDTLLLHSAGNAELLDPAVGETLGALKRSGLIARAGASTYGSAAAALALSQPWCDVVQIEYSVLNPSVLVVAREARRVGQEVIVRSVLCSGLLTDEGVADVSLSADARGVLDELATVARRWSMSLQELAVRFALDSPGVDVALVGAVGIDELDVAIGAAARPPLTSVQMTQLAALDRGHESWTHPEQWTAQ